MSEPSNETLIAQEPGSTPVTSSTAKKLAQAAALAAMLVPLGSIAVESSTITCSFTNDTGAYVTCNDGAGGAEGFFGGKEALYSFADGAYTLDLRFDLVNGPFSIAIEDFATTQDSYGGSGSAGSLENFPNALCVPIADADTGCIEFRLTDGAGNPPADAGEGTWSNSGDNGYTMILRWTADTDGTFPNGAGNIRLLKESDFAYDTDLTIAGSYCNDLDISCFPDPGISGFGKSFSGDGVGVFLTPEPTSLLLLGTGISGLLYRRRRKRQKP